MDQQQPVGDLRLNPFFHQISTCVFCCCGVLYIFVGRKGVIFSTDNLIPMVLQPTHPQDALVSVAERFRGSQTIDGVNVGLQGFGRPQWTPKTNGKMKGF